MTDLYRFFSPGSQIETLTLLRPEYHTLKARSEDIAEDAPRYLQTEQDLICDAKILIALEGDAHTGPEKVLIRFASYDNEGGLYPAFGHAEDVMEAADGPKFPGYA